MVSALFEQPLGELKISVASLKSLIPYSTNGKIFVVSARAVIPVRGSMTVSRRFSASISRCPVEHVEKRRAYRMETCGRLGCEAQPGQAEGPPSSIQNHMIPYLLRWRELIGTQGNLFIGHRIFNNTATPVSSKMGRECRSALNAS